MKYRNFLRWRAGPKLPQLARRAHPLMHKALHIGMPVMLGTGLLAGLLAPFSVRNFGIFPLESTFEAKGLHALALNVLLFMGILHATFHHWHHFWTKDNALRITLPRMLHRWL